MSPTTHPAEKASPLAFTLDCTLDSALDSIVAAAGVWPLTDRAFLRITGPDASRWLNGMVTNNVKDLAPGAGNYSFLLNAQGRILGDCTIYSEPDAAAGGYILETTRDQAAAIQQHLDRFIIMDDVELLPVMDDQRGLLLFGERAGEYVTAVAPIAPAPGAILRSTFESQPILVAATHSPFTPAFELWPDAATIARLRSALEAAGAQTASAALVEHMRIRNRTPRYGQDIRNTETARDLPQETAQDHALHFSKGCYVGQEIVERIHARGSVHRVFAQFHLSGDAPTLPTPLFAENKAIGELTSASGSLALGYIRREALHQPLTYLGGNATPSANARP